MLPVKIYVWFTLGFRHDSTFITAYYSLFIKITEKQARPVQNGVWWFPSVVPKCMLYLKIYSNTPKLISSNRQSLIHTFKKLSQLIANRPGHFFVVVDLESVFFSILYFDISKDWRLPGYLSTVSIEITVFPELI